MGGSVRTAFRMGGHRGSWRPRARQCLTRALLGWAAVLCGGAAASGAAAGTAEGTVAGSAAGADAGAVAGTAAGADAETIAGTAAGADAGAALSPPEALLYKGWTVAGLEIHGLTASQEGDLKSGLALHPQSQILRTQHASFYPSLLEEDLARTRLFLARHGFPRARIATEFEPVPSSQSLKVRLRIDPGPRAVVASVDLRGWPDQITPPSAESLPLKPGATFQDDALARTLRGIESRLHQEGYARASVSADVSARDARRVAVTLRCESGDLLRYSGIRVEGAAADLVPLIRRTTGIAEGDLCTTSSRQAAQENLRLLGLFRQVRLDLEEDAPGRAILLVIVTARRPRSVEYGVGYWSEEFLRTRFQWTHRNLFRGGRGGKIGAAYSRYLQTLESAVWWPSLLGARTGVVLSGAAERQDEEGYDLRETRGGLSIRYRHSQITTFSAGLTASSVNWDEKGRRADVIKPGGLLTYASAWWLRDGSDNRLDPTRGSVLRLGGEWALPGRLSHTHYLSLQSEWSAYLNIVGSLVWANHLEIGWVRPLSDTSEILPNKRFYAGGYSSMRGFKRRKLGPLTEEAAPAGGEALMASSFEVRFPIWSRIRGAGFLDAAQVWADHRDLALSDLEWAAGPALTLRTPVGPARADVGFRLTKRQPGQPDKVFHLSVGHPF
jgi:outer membrane protein assembly factor BamA